MNQHDHVEQALAEHDEQATKARNVAAALVEIERCICLLAGHVDCRSFDARCELSSALDTLRRAVRAVETDV